MSECPEVLNNEIPFFSPRNHRTVFDSSFQQIQAQQIIVIHPGSLNLRIGRASDLNPHRLLHAVARRRKPNGAVYADPFLPPSVEKVCVRMHLNFMTIFRERALAHHLRARNYYKNSKNHVYKCRTHYNHACSRMAIDAMQHHRNKLPHLIDDLCPKFLSKNRTIGYIPI